jgi:hypothetical protein
MKVNIWHAGEHVCSANCEDGRVTFEGTASGHKTHVEASFDTLRGALGYECDLSLFQSALSRLRREGYWVDAAAAFSEQSQRG